MIGFMNNYFIKASYLTNPPVTFSESPLEYWTNKRISSSHYFQYHIYEFAADHFKKNDMKSVLDIGAGPGTKLLLFFDLEKIELDLIDQPGMDEVVLKKCPKGSFFGHNLEDDSFSTGKTYDMIICADVIEHMNNPTALLNIIKNHMHSETVCVLSTPERDMRRGKSNFQSPNKAHVREWSYDEMKKYVSSEGLKIVHHRNMPLKKLGAFSYWISQIILYKKIFTPNWFGNQLLLLKLA